MASKKKAAAAEGKVVITRSTAKAQREEKRKAEDVQAAEDAKKAKAAKDDPKVRKTKGAAEADESKEQEKLADQAKLENEALMHRQQKLSASLRHGVMAPRTIAMTDAEYEAVVNNLDKFRAEDRAKLAKAGGQPVPGKRFLVSDGQLVRVGGTTYNIPAGRHEMTPEFLKEHFPAGTSADDLAGGIYARRFRFETEGDDNPRAATASGAGSAPLHVRDAVVERSTHKPYDIYDTDQRNYLEGKGTR